jgi:membrane fusion protein, multidrug efflux system
MPAIEAQRDATNRDGLAPRDVPSGISNKHDDPLAEVKDEKPRIDHRQDENKERPKQEESKQGKKPAKPLATWPLVLGAIALAAFIALVVWIIFRPRPDVWTDDAYIAVHYANIAPRIPGQIATVPVDDNQTVKAGQVLATLDPRDYETAVASVEAEAALARDTAQLAEVIATLARQPSLINEQEAEVTSDRARLAFTEPDARRYRDLAPTGAVTVQQQQQTESAL